MPGLLPSLWCIVLVLSFCSARSPAQEWADTSLVGTWTSSSDDHIYEFPADGSYTLTDGDGDTMTGSYAARALNYLYIELDGVSLDIHLGCMPDNELVFQQTVDNIYSEAIWYRVDGAPVCPAPTPTPRELR
jgi:hypothetical protein